MIIISHRPNGRYVAASTASPYFCFEADSEKDVKQIVDAAYKFYAASLTHPVIRSDLTNHTL